jgi:hypothetical protein
MRNTILLVLAGLAAGFAVLRWLPGDAPDAPVTSPAPSATATASSAALRAPSMRAPAVPSTPAPPIEIETPTQPSPPLGGEDDHEAATAEASVASAVAAAPPSAESRIDGLVAAGFTADRAAAILRREAELRQQAYFSEFEASGTVRALSGAARDNAADRLRAELSDADYERYLEGTGQPRSIFVRAVEPSSAAAHAGLVPGDELRSYAGRRVFNQRELNTLMSSGTPGEIVPTTVVRDGVTLELYVTRGPLGLM